MDPTFGNWYNQYYRPDPYGRAFSFTPPPTAHPVQRQPVPKKVFQIPVTDGGSISKPVIDRSASAVKIQKVFRGFMVRKSLRRITDVKKQVDEIEVRLSSRDVVELIRRDDKERLRMSESLMSLLLKLDSIRGFDLGVRDCRKAVIRKAIALQERIDSFLSAGNLEVPNCDETGEEEPDHENVGDESKLSDHEDMEDCCGGEDGEMESVVDVEAEKKDDFVPEEDDELDNWIEVEGESKSKGEEGEKKDNELMVERLVKDNEKMMSMMRQLFDSNEKQMKMLSALAHRVELLEKAFICDKNRRKPKQKRKE